jgi:hypothetical protein
VNEEYRAATYMLLRPFNEVTDMVYREMHINYSKVFSHLYDFSPRGSSDFFTDFSTLKNFGYRGFGDTAKNPSPFYVSDRTDFAPEGYKGWDYFANMYYTSNNGVVADTQDAIFWSTEY